ncbi:MAG: response regulator [Eudoraea sp.]|uniref:response regulator n=1 Tax=Eudoraea sp. TaxID=1979955 RepID=UPI0032634717
MKLKILIVDDHPFTRAGIRSILEDEKTIEIMGEACDGEEAIRMALEKSPDVIIMDITMPKVSGIIATQKILEEKPDIKIIALSIHSGHNFVKKMLDGGALGYLLKDDIPEDLIRAIEKVSQGDIFLSSGVTRTALDKDENLPEYSVLRSKLVPPPIMDYYLSRNRITEELEQNINRPLTLVSAGAGFGKSTTISLWLEQTQRFHAWVSLCDEHNDLRVFLIYMVTALNQIHPGSMSKSEKVIKNDPLPTFKELTLLLFNELCNIDQNLILVLDDFHNINDKNILRFLDEWLLYPPPCVHLTLITRRDPALNLETLRLKGQITEIRMSDLSFTNHEIAMFFNQSTDIELSDSQVQNLHKKTEGWIIAIRLVSMTIKSSEDINKVLNKLDGGLKLISNYLISEVLSQLPENLRKSMVKSSLLDKFCEDLLNELGIEAKEFIEWLKNLNLFITPLDTNGKWYRYHPLFQILLRHQLSVYYSQEEIKTLQLKADHWFKNNKFHKEFLDDESAKKGSVRQNRTFEKSMSKQKDALNVFTKKEFDVLKCVALGMTNQEIAYKLFNSEETIKKHINNMFQKLYVKNRLSLVNRAKEEGII